jgi:hypothetical protein
MKSLEWRDVDLTNGVVTLRAENSKNKDGREIPFSRFPELAEILASAHDNRRLDCRVPRGPKVTWAPRRPRERLEPLVDQLSETPLQIRGRR